MTATAVRRGFYEQVLWSLATLLAGLAVVLATWGAKTPKLSPGDPGPWGLPLACGVLLMICAVAELYVQWRRGGWAGEPSAAPSPEIPGLAAKVPAEPALAGDEIARLTLGDWLTIGAIGLYCLLIPRVGFTLATLVLVPILLARFGAPWHWLGSLMLGGVMVALVRLIFGSVFGVQLP